MDTTHELQARAGKLRGTQVIDFNGTTWLVAQPADTRFFTTEHEAAGWAFGVAETVTLASGRKFHAMQVAIKAEALS